MVIKVHSMFRKAGANLNLNGPRPFFIKSAVRADRTGGGVEYREKESV